VLSGSRPGPPNLKENTTMPEAIAATLFLTVVFAEAAHLGSVALDLIKPVPYRYVPASVRRAEAECARLRAMRNA
jgi:hypothetical protein